MGNVSIAAAAPTSVRKQRTQAAARRIHTKLLHWAAVPAETITELAEFIAIPSVSPDPARSDDVLRAGDWVVEKIRAAGGEAERIDWNGQPLVVGEIRASHGA